MRREVDGRRRDRSVENDRRPPALLLSRHDPSDPHVARRGHNEESFLSRDIHCQQIGNERWVDVGRDPPDAVSRLSVEQQDGVAGFLRRVDERCGRARRTIAGEDHDDGPARAIGVVDPRGQLGGNLCAPRGFRRAALCEGRLGRGRRNGDRSVFLSAVGHLAGGGLEEDHVEHLVRRGPHAEVRPVRTRFGADESAAAGHRRLPPRLALRRRFSQQRPLRCVG